MEAGGGELVTPEIPALVAPDPALLDERQKCNFDLLIAQAADAILQRIKAAGIAYRISESGEVPSGEMVFSASITCSRFG